MKKKHLNKLIFTFLMLLASFFGRLEAKDSIYYFKEILKTYKIEAKILPVETEDALQTLSITPNETYIVKSRDYPQYTPIFNADNPFSNDLIIVCTESFKFNDSISCTNESVTGLPGQVLNLDTDIAILITTLANNRVIIFPENALVMTDKQPKIVSALQSLFGVKTDIVKTERQMILNDYLIPWIQIIVVLISVFGVLLGFYLTVKKPVPFVSLNIKQSAEKVIQSVGGYLLRYRLKITMGLIFSSVTAFLAACIFTLIRYKALKINTIKQALIFLSNFRESYNLLVREKYFELFFVVLFYCMLAIALIFLAMATADSIFNLRKSQNKVILSNNYHYLYITLTILAFVSLPVIYDTRLLPIILSLDLLVIIRYGHKLFDISHLNLKSYRKVLLFVLTLLFAGYLIIYSFGTKSSDSTSGNVSFVNFISSANDKLLLPVKTSIDPKSQRFYSYLISPKSRIFVNNLLIFDPMYRKIYNEPLRNYDSSKNHILVYKHENEYLKFLLDRPETINIFKSETKTRLFVIPPVNQTGNINVEFTFDCLLNPEDFGLTLTTFRSENDRVSEVKIKPLHFPGCNANEIEKTYIVSLNTVDKAYELEEIYGDFVKGIRVQNGNDFLQVIYVKAPLNYTFASFSKTGTDEIYVYSSGLEQSYKLENLSTNFDMGEAINGLINSGYNEQKLRVWSDINAEILFKLDD